MEDDGAQPTSARRVHTSSSKARPRRRDPGRPVPYLPNGQASPCRSPPLARAPQRGVSLPARAPPCRSSPPSRAPPRRSPPTARVLPGRLACRPASQPPAGLPESQAGGGMETGHPGAALWRPACGSFPSNGGRPASGRRVCSSYKYTYFV
jgi:hypothetical protein